MGVAQQFLQAFTRSEYWIWYEISNTTFYHSILIVLYCYSLFSMYFIITVTLL